MGGELWWLDGRVLSAGNFPLFEIYFFCCPVWEAKIEVGVEGSDGGGSSKSSGSFAALRMTARTGNGKGKCNGVVDGLSACYPTHRKVRDEWGTRRRDSLR